MESPPPAEPGSRGSFSVLMISTLVATCALVLTVIGAFTYQISLKDHENLVRSVYADWNVLLSDAKSLETSSRPIRETAGRFLLSLQTFRESLAALGRKHFSFSARLEEKSRSFHDSLAFGVQYVADLEGWLNRLSASFELRDSNLAELRAAFDPLEARWIRIRLGDLDDLFGRDLSQLKGRLDELIHRDLREASDRSLLLGLLVLAGLSALLTGLLFRIRRMNLRLNELVLRRTHHLEQAQRKLVASEKLAVLGSLAAGVAHELNTPLAALQSAGQTVAGFFSGALDGELRALEALPPTSRETLYRILALAFSRGGVTYQQTRAALKELRTRLRAYSAVSMEEQAECWLELGLASEEAVWGPLCRSPETLPILNLARRFAEARKMAEVIVQAVGKAGNVVSALRHYLEGSRSEEVSSFSLKKEWETVLVLLGTGLKKGIAVVLDINVEIQVRGAKEGLAQVWLNLANNAIQSMNAKGTLTIDARRRHDRVIVQVRDTGPGIPPDLADQVFTPFFTTKKDTGGLGLGLDICRKIVESNLGTISFQSSPGNTVFSVELPAATS